MDANSLNLFSTVRPTSGTTGAFASITTTASPDFEEQLRAFAAGQRAAAEQFERLQRHLRAFQRQHGLPPSPPSTGPPGYGQQAPPASDPRMFQAPERLSSSRQGHHSYVIGGARFDIPQRYTPVKLLGQGAYGIVIAAKDNTTGDNVAIKKIPNAFANLTDTKRTLREIKLLRHLQHENVISLRDIFRPPSRAEFDDLYLVSQLMDTDLHQIIASSNVLTDEHCQYFLYQMLRGLKYIHSANVLHRDLKPSNLLLNQDCLLKIADFGLARVEDDQQGFMTEYVATRWYRAPEVILSWKEYTKAIDVWSVGCIFAELLVRRPFFQGKDYIHQVIRITEILGTPCDEDVECIANEQARRYIRSLGQRPPIPLERLLPGANPLAIDLLRRMLAFNPAKRCTVEEALAHPYLEGLHDPECEPMAASHFVFEFEKWPLQRPLFQELIWQEMLFFHPEAADLPAGPAAMALHQQQQAQLALLQQQQAAAAAQLAAAQQQHQVLAAQHQQQAAQHQAALLQQQQQAAQHQQQFLAQQQHAAQLLHAGSAGTQPVPPPAPQSQADANDMDDFSAIDRYMRSIV